MGKRTLLFFILSFSILIYTGCSMQSSTDYKIKTYKDNNFKFSVDYPADWKSIIEKTYKATAEHERSPDGGINIYVENYNEDNIYVYGQNGHINIPGEGFGKESFTTESGLKGYLLFKTIDSKKELYLIFDDGFHAAHAIINSDSFNENEKKIMGIFRSFRLL